MTQALLIWRKDKWKGNQNFSGSLWTKHFLEEASSCMTKGRQWGRSQIPCDIYLLTPFALETVSTSRYQKSWWQSDLWGVQNIYLSTWNASYPYCWSKWICKFAITYILLHFKEKTLLVFLRPIPFQCSHSSVPEWQRSKNGYMQSAGELALGVYS